MSSYNPKYLGTLSIYSRFGAAPVDVRNIGGNTISQLKSCALALCCGRDGCLTITGMDCKFTRDYKIHSNAIRVYKWGK